MPRLALYARCSTADQVLDAQLDSLREYAARRGGEAEEYADAGVSGASAKRPALARLLEAVHRRQVDAVVVTKLDRLARSVRHLCELAADFEARGVALVVLDQGIDTSTPSGRFLFHTLGAVAELERELIVERTRAGLAAARRRGARLGRPRRLSEVDVARVHRLAGLGRSQRAIAELLGIGKATVARELARRRAA
jgi:DNA invertase Pin-like site-specific DNA recombinase